VETLKEHDPIPLFSNELRSTGLLTDAIDEQLRSDVKAQINDASKRAEARVEPDVATAGMHVYGPEAD
jgi:TPP-dependent pyruvate/acetoin dehydrogenase alpha subunit